MPKTTYAANLINEMYRLTTPTLPAGFYLALLTTLPDNTGSGAVEASYSGYARVRIDNKLAAAASKQIASNAAINFTTVPTNTGTFVRGFAIYDASTSGNMWEWEPFATEQRAFTALASSEVLSCPGNSFQADDPVRLFKVDDSPLPTGLSEGVTYYVRNISGNTFKLAATAGGTAIDVTADGSGQISRIIEQPLNAGVTPQFVSGAFILSMF